MKRRLMMAVGMSVLLVAALLPATTAARSPQGAGYERVDAATLELIKASGVQPASLDRNRKVTVIVELTGRPVASYQGDALEVNPLRPLSSAARAQLRSKIAAQQNAIKRSVAAAGGRVLASYRDALNGLKVEVSQGKIAQLSRLNGVKKVHAVPVHTRTNDNSARYIRAPQAWGQTNRTGAGVTIAVIDTGIDYYHANFGGSGNPDDYENDDPTMIEGDSFPTAKVVDGFDFAGDCYDASAGEDDPPDPTDPNCPAGYSDIPDPDPDPLDCDGHGSHVAGTAAGYGVEDTGSSEVTYTGPYNESTLTANDFVIGPGMAPRAKIVALKVFGCEGSTNVTVDAIDYAVATGVDVINMSLGSSFGRADDLAAIASDYASEAGIVVVASAGNSGPSAYITGAPASGTRGISVTAIDALPSLPTVTVDLASQPDQQGINANDSEDLPVTGVLNVFENKPTTPQNDSLGCTAADYAANGFVQGQIAVVYRGVCPRVDRPIVGDAQGAKAVIMINNEDAFPPFEGPIVGADIPFVGVRSSSADEFVASDNTSATINAGPVIPNPTYKFLASFTSGGPRNGDSALKPDITGPGVSVISTLVGGGTRGASLSGTSMASPAVAGAAALVVQAHPAWLPAHIKSALIGTADATSARFASGEYDVRIAGAGVANARRAVDTTTYVNIAPGQASLSYGYDQAGSTGYSETKEFRLVNRSNSSISYALSASFTGPTYGANMSISPSSVTVPANSNRTIRATLSLSSSEVNALPDALLSSAEGFQPLTTVQGAIIVNPSGSSAGRYNIRVPFLAVPRGVSDIVPGKKSAYSESGGALTASLVVRNDGAHRGDADFYQWDLLDGGNGYESNDLRAVGSQTFVCDDIPALGCEEDDRFMVFGVNTWGRWSNVSTEEFDILLDTDEDEDVDYVVFGFDAGAVLAGSFDGTYIALTCEVVNAGTPEESCDLIDGFFIDVPPNGSTVSLPTVARGFLDIDANDEVEYTAASFNLVPGGPEDIVNDDAGDPVYAPINPFDPQLYTEGEYAFVSNLGKGQSTTVDLFVGDSQFEEGRAARGWMIVTLDDRNGAEQADLVPVGPLPAR